MGRLSGSRAPLASTFVQAPLHNPPPGTHPPSDCFCKRAPKCSRRSTCWGRNIPPPCSSSRAQRGGPGSSPRHPPAAALADSHRRPGEAAARVPGRRIPGAGAPPGGILGDSLAGGSLPSGDNRKGEGSQPSSLQTYTADTGKSQPRAFKVKLLLARSWQ